MANLKRNFMYQSLYQVLTMILPLITSPILSRALGANGLGIYTYVTTIEGYFALIANLGIYKYGTREIAKAQNDKEKISKIFWEIWILHALLSVIVGLVYIFYIATVREYTLFFAISFLSYLASVASLNWLFTGVEDFRKITIRDTIIKGISFVLIIILVRDETDLTTYFWLMSLCGFLGASFYWKLYKEYVSHSKVDFRESFKHCKGMCILFIPLLLENLFNSMDKVMLGMFCAKTEVGYYGNAEKVLISKRLIYSISIVLLPKMSYLLSQKNKEEFNRLMKQSIGMIILMASAFGFGTAAVAKEFSLVFWGEEFAECANLIIILSLAIPGTMVANAIREQYLIASGNEKKYLFAVGAGTLMNLIMNMILIPKYGAIGAAVATLVSEYTVFLVQILAVKKSIPIFSYIHGSEIYPLFGFVMFIVIRWIAGMLSGGIGALLLEVIVGVVVFMCLCIPYWIIFKQYYYLDLIRKCIEKILQHVGKK